METIKIVPYKVSRTKWNIDSLRLSSLFERERNFTISEPKSGLIFFGAGRYRFDVRFCSVILSFGDSLPDTDTKKSSLKTEAGILQTVFFVSVALLFDLSAPKTKT